MFLADVQKTARGPFSGETTASMRSPILIQIPYTILYKLLIKNINEIPNSNYNSLYFLVNSLSKPYFIKILFKNHENPVRSLILIITISLHHVI